MKLPYEIDRYGGAILSTPETPIDADEFTQQLNTTIEELKGQERALCWLFLSSEQASLINPAVVLGFEFHHADQSGLQLYCRLVPNAFVPGYATHYVGAGGVVIDEENRILTIQEKYHTRKHYKLPGGALDPKEHISDGVVREVFEETGIRTEFISLNCFRHWHGYRYGKSDIYFVCRLKPLSHEITMDTSELSEAVWMPIEDFMNHPETHPFNRKIVNTALASRGLLIEEIDDYGTPETHEMMF